VVRGGCVSQGRGGHGPCDLCWVVVSTKCAYSLILKSYYGVVVSIAIMVRTAEYSVLSRASGKNPPSMVLRHSQRRLTIPMPSNLPTVQPWCASNFYMRKPEATSRATATRTETRTVLPRIRLVPSGVSSRSRYGGVWENDLETWTEGGYSLVPPRVRTPYYFPATTHLHGALCYQS
jgi:hypothetical protein